ncbi:hypothetical protein H4R33_003515 [Dimargaris cristalligena]|uniref:SH3 domain-containing protein n=1 Tax=Dimargaris cristalligena TaxID=215637 RepID=A0A4P9ZYM9_9FUNG|nr:hypothetical protein H4R33_003515 [Dimargaris cristalligena]RKP37870.1 hypothetical protein BJ085DRAFT_31307 [Dimargaris cristalligena]|eukprot:RKP37870.1 hypothetical protein BJ085DRAFT_31307 [Dimargaris cristalligena]
MPSFLYEPSFVHMVRRDKATYAIDTSQSDSNSNSTIIIVVIVVCVVIILALVGIFVYRGVKRSARRRALEASQPKAVQRDSAYLSTADPISGHSSRTYSGASIGYPGKHLYDSRTSEKFNSFGSQKTVQSHSSQILAQVASPALLVTQYPPPPSRSSQPQPVFGVNRHDDLRDSFRLSQDSVVLEAPRIMHFATIRQPPAVAYPKGATSIQSSPRFDRLAPSTPSPSSPYSASAFPGVGPAATEGNKVARTPSHVPRSNTSSGATYVPVATHSPRTSFSSHTTITLSRAPPPPYTAWTSAPNLPRTSLVVPTAAAADLPALLPTTLASANTTTPRARQRSPSVRASSIRRMTQPHPPVPQTAQFITQLDTPNSSTISVAAVTTAQPSSPTPAAPPAAAAPPAEEQPISIIGTYSATRSYEPEMPDELLVEVGDGLAVIQHFDDGWVLGINLTRGRAQGVFPEPCIEPVSDY